MKKLYLIAALFLCACAAGGNPYNSTSIPAPPKGYAQVIVYWPEWMNGFSVNVDVGDLKCPVLPNSYVLAQVNAGEIKVTDGDSVTNIKAKDGHRYFVKMSQNKSRSASQAAAGLVGIFIHDAVTHGSPDSGAYVFEVMNDDYAKKQLSALKENVSGCK